MNIFEHSIGWIAINVDITLPRRMNAFVIK